MMILPVSSEAGATHTNCVVRLVLPLKASTIVYTTICSTTYTIVYTVQLMLQVVPVLELGVMAAIVRARMRFRV